jgi:hypothetical protein
MKIRISGILLSVLLAAGTAAVADASTSKFITSDDLQTFDAQSKDVIAAMAKGGRFQYVSTPEQARVTELLGVIRGVISNYSDLKAMSDRDKLLVFNSQEEVNEILTRGDGKRLICENTAPVGSHLARKSCITFEKQEQQREDAQRMLQSVPTASGSSGG